MFEDRIDAGKRLAENLTRYRDNDAVVLALPRGGVVVGYEIAMALHLPLDIVVTRKIGHPSNPEYAICAVDALGTLLCSEPESASVNQAWLKEKTNTEMKEAERRGLVYRAGKKPVDISGKVVIITDDGVATGLSLRLAIMAVKAQKPKRVVVAVPVAPSDVVSKIKREVDELIILEPPEDFRGAVGAHYRHFDQVEDEDVIRLMGK